MSGVLKVVGKIASVVAMVPGPWQLPATLIAVGATVGASALAKRPKTPQPSRESIDRLNASIDPRAPRKMVFGQTAMATDIRDQEYTNNQEYLHRFIVVAAHKVQSIDEIWFDDKKAWTATGGAQGEYAGYLTVTPILEGNAGNAINISARMGSTRRFTGCAYVHLRYKLTGNSKKADSPFAQGIATRMTIRGKGALVYDPRKDSTVPGGSGSHRANDQSTWAWDANASRNPALQKLWYLLGWRINGKLSVGRGIPPNRIDLESYAIGANLCDEAVTLAAGGTEPRYRSDGVFSEGDSPTTVMDNFKAAMNADLDDVGGQLRLTVFHNDLADPVAAFGDDDMIEGFKWSQTPSLVDSFNLVRGSYTDASDKSLYQMVDYPQVELVSPDGIERPDSFDLALVQSPSQAQRLANQRLQRQQYGGEYRTVWGARGWLVQKNSVVTQSCTVMGWTNKLFRVAEMEHRVDGTCPVTLREENAEIYAWDKDERPAVDPADPTVYDFTKSPIYLGLDGTGKMFVQTIAPSADQSTGGDIWQADDGRYWDRRDDIALTCNGEPLTCNGVPLTMVWTPASSQPVRDGLDAALATALAATEAAVELAKDAQATADGKVQSFYRPSAPTAEGVGDLWFDTDDGNKQYRWSGSAWVPVQDAKIGDALTAAAGAQATADGKAATFFSETAPTAEGVGDLWLKQSTGELRRWSGTAWGDPLVDLTAAAIPRHEPASAAMTFTGNSTGVITPADQLPETLLIQRFVGLSDVSGDGGTTWTVDYVEGVTGASPTVVDGELTLPTGLVISPSGALIRVKSERSGFILFTDVTLTQINAPPNNNGSGTGGTTVNDSTIDGVSTTSLVKVSDTMTVKTGSAGEIDFSGVLSLTGTKGVPTGSFGAVARWRYRALPAGSWTWAGAQIDDTVPLEVTLVSGEPPNPSYFERSLGQITVARNQTGLAANTDHEVELHAARDSATGTRTISFGGTATATGK